MNNKVNNENEKEVEYVAARDFLMSNINKIAVEEACPLNDYECKYLDDRLCRDKQESKDVLDYFHEDDRHMQLMERIGCLLQKAVEQSSQSDLGKRKEFLDAVYTLEKSEDDFMLWACAVPALAHFEKKSGINPVLWIILTIPLFMLIYILYLAYWAK